MTAPAELDFRLNGTMRTIAVGASVADVVTQLIGNGRGIAVALNEQIVPRLEWPSTTLQPDDRVEIVTIVAGG